MKPKQFDFAIFLLAFIFISLTGYILTLFSADRLVYIGAYTLISGIVGVSLFIYLFPIIKRKLRPSYKITDIGDRLLRGKDGSRITAKKRPLDKRIRRNKI